MGLSFNIELITIEMIHFSSLINSPIKQMFGNRKNFRKYYYAHRKNLEYETWNNWLISLGYRE